MSTIKKILETAGGIDRILYGSKRPGDCPKKGFYMTTWPHQVADGGADKESRGWSIFCCN